MRLWALGGSLPPRAVPEAVPSPTARHYLLGVFIGSGSPPYLQLCLLVAVRRRLWVPKCALSAPSSLLPGTEEIKAPSSLLSSSALSKEL